MLRLGLRSATRACDETNSVTQQDQPQEPEMKLSVTQQDQSQEPEMKLSVAQQDQSQEPEMKLSVTQQDQSQEAEVKLSVMQQDQSQEAEMKLITLTKYLLQSRFKITLLSHQRIKMWLNINHINIHHRFLWLILLCNTVSKCYFHHSFYCLILLCNTVSPQVIVADPAV